MRLSFPTKTLFLTQNTLLLLLSLTLAPLVWAAGGSYPLDKAPIDLNNKASLQRGAKLFVNYCMGCHSAQYQRYNRMARDIGLTDDQVQQYLIFTAGTKVGDTMQNGMRTAEARQWFGAAPPDLTVIARARGADYLYTYLRTFYLDESRPWGVNNAAFPNTGMPHVLWELQGWQQIKHGSEAHAHSASHDTQRTSFEIVKPGSMTPVEFDKAIADLVNFMVYMGEPIQLERQRIGVWVLIFLFIMLAVFYPLKKEYWKDVK